MQPKSEMFIIRTDYAGLPQYRMFFVKVSATSVDSVTRLMRTSRNWALRTIVILYGW